METNDTKDRELLLTRTLNAPVALVWEVFTNAEHIANWWGPNGFANTITVMDVRPGGQWNLVMHGPDGTDYKNRSIFKEVILHKKIVFLKHVAPKTSRLPSVLRNRAKKRCLTGTWFLKVANNLLQW